MTPLRILWAGAIVLFITAATLTASALLGLALWGGLRMPGL